MATERSREDIISLIQKCLALTHSDKPGEAANAAAKAQELLFKYHLDMAEVEASEPGEDSLINEESYNLNPRAHEGKWRLSLINHIARHNFCKVLWGYKGRYATIIGTKIDVEAVKEIYLWVAEQLVEMEPSYWKAAQDVFDRRPTFRRSFFEGAVGEVNHRLYKQRDTSRAESEKSTALIVQSDKDLKDYMEKEYPKGTLRAARMGGSYGSSAGLSAGREAGGKVTISRQPKRLPGRGLID